MADNKITAAMVNELRQKTGLPMMDCKRALEDKQRAARSITSRCPFVGGSNEPG